MTDFSKLFADPSAEAYGPDQHESAMWQQSSSNPFAVLHAIAARRGANNRRDQYGEQLAAHDERAVTGTRGLMADENKYNSLQEMIKQQMIDPGTVGDLSGLRNPGNSQRFDELSAIYTGGKRASAFKDIGAGQKDLKAGARQVDNLSDLTRNVGIGDIAADTTPGEDEQAAKLKADLGTQTRTETFIAKPGDPSTVSVTTKQPLATNRNAPGAAPRRPVGPATPQDLKGMPTEQKRALNELTVGAPMAGSTFKAVPGTVMRGSEGEIIVNVRGVVGGKTMDMQIEIAPDGRTYDITESK